MKLKNINKGEIADVPYSFIIILIVVSLAILSIRLF